MKRAIVWALALLLVLGPAPVWATGCHTFNYAGTYHAAKVAVVEKAVAVATFIPVAIPVFSAVYQPAVAVPAVAAPAPVAAPAAAQQTQDALLRYLQRLEQRLDGIERRLAPGAAPAAPLPPPAGQPPAQANSVQQAMQAFVQTKCARCHGNGGQGGLSLLEGGRLVDPGKLTPGQQLAMLKRCYSQDPAVAMPPPNKGIEAVSDQEYGLVQAWIAGAR